MIKTHKSILLFSIIIFSLCSVIFLLMPKSLVILTENSPKKIPNDWFLAQRVFPLNEIRNDIYKQELEKINNKKNSLAKENGSWQFAGPTNIGGRITDIEMTTNSFDTIYAGAASGGVIKSINGGESWSSIFDNSLSLSIGDIAVDPVNTSIIYVGTGEVNAGGGSMTYDGMGIFKSIDGGINWKHLGLDETRYISRIVIDPKNHNRIFLGAMGKLFAENNERGVYKSDDGGLTWKNVLYISGKTGCIDLVIDPIDPNNIYAAMWERIRDPGSRDYGGAECGIYKSIDGGESWNELTNGIPNKSPYVGRIGLSISNSNPNIIYSIYADNTGYFTGVYKSENGGSSWLKTTGSPSASVYSSFGWWFGNIRVNPINPNEVYILGLDVFKTIDGGNTWNKVSDNVHVDQHAMYIHPQNTNFVVLGNDGGIYKSETAGLSWSKSLGLPITQFYTCEIDYQNPERLYGGTQDNFTIRTTTGSIDDWQPITGGDGFYVLVDPNNNNYIYSESQYGNIYRSTTGGSSFISAIIGINLNEPSNWNTPFVFNPSNTSTLYYGTNRVYKSIDRAVTWYAISNRLADLHSGNLTFGTITTISVAPSDSNYIYAGTDDGYVWVTKDGGSNWDLISSSLPVRWITRVAVDPYNKNIAYVTLSGYRQDDYLPHIFKTEDAGINWLDISGGLPEVPLNDVIVDSINTAILYVASDVGVFIKNTSGNWSLLGSDLPNVPIMDITFHNPTRTIVAATYGRSMYKFDLNQITGIKDNQKLKNEFSLSQNYPNPFNPSTKIRFTIPSKNKNQFNKSNELSEDIVSLVIYDILGKKISTLINEKKTGGIYEVEFNATGLASGIYFINLTKGKYTASKKMILLK